MAVSPSQPVYTSPKTLSHMRVVIDRLKRGNTEVTDAVFVGGTVDATLAIGDVVYAPSNGNFDKAIATGLSTSRVVGISTTVVASGAQARIQTGGIVTVPGASFTVDTVHYLSPTVAGDVTTTAPTTVAQTVVSVAIAISATELKLLSVPPILL